MMTTDLIRKKFLDFFKSKGHEIAASDLLVPENDPSVLFTSAGMNQFKEQFMGKISGYRRAASSQKCLRTGDLERVGKTSSHHTFFEMLGNFSFGDYFKKEAIQWAWEFLTGELKIDAARLRVSVYEEDDEAYALWRDEIKVPEERIYRFGQKDNFWPANAITDGPNGPCGPCSEIFYDLGQQYGCAQSECSPACDCGRFVEIWNLVFTQFNRKENGKLDPLPNKNIDTGMGLERMAACMQAVSTNFEIDIFKPLISDIVKTLNTQVGDHRDKINCIADHIRAVIFAIGDGVLPSNESRGYVIRKLIRRASWFAQELGYSKAFLYTLVSRVCELMKSPYPELLKRRDNIAGIIRGEEERFISNLKEGNSYLDTILADVERANQRTLSGEIIFKLYDTYGFPLELTQMYAQQNTLELDLMGFNKRMAQQKEMARKKSVISGDIFSQDILEVLPSQFTGYQELDCEAKIIQIIHAKKNVALLSAGQEGWLVLDKTPFYGEAGGQIGDTGDISTSNAVARVVDTQKYDGSTIHVVSVKKGSCRVGDQVRASVDKERRDAIRRAHTATHLLQSALRSVLGTHVQQSGSLVEPDQFRFDFTHFRDVKDEELARVQDIINEYIRANDTVSVAVLEKEQALKSGALALFGEKYGAQVRIISIGNYSKEFCGGTHLDSTGNIALLLIGSESSIGSGVRRIEASTGKRAYEKMKRSIAALKEMSIRFKVAPEPEIVLNESIMLFEEKKYQEKRIASLQRDILSYQIPEILERSKIICNDITLVVHLFKGFDADRLRIASDLFIEKIPKKAVLFLASTEGVFGMRISKDLKGQLDVNRLLNDIIKPFGGSGGGRPDFAQGGITDVAAVDRVLNQARELVKKEIEGLS